MNSTSLQKIDVVVCTKNSGRTLRQVLERVVKYIPVNRLIVVDGGSTDQTVEIAKEFGAEIHFDGGRGLGYARNMALKIVETPIFAFIDSDALIPRNWMNLMKYFKDPKVAVASGFAFFGPETSVLKALHRYQLRKYRVLQASLSNSLLRLDVVKAVGGIREDLPSSEDTDLYDRIIKREYKWVIDRNIISYQRRDLMQHLAHAKWWGQGTRAAGYPMRKMAWYVIKSPLTAIALMLTGHPALLLYYPLLKLQGYLGYLKEAKAERHRHAA